MAQNCTKSCNDRTLEIVTILPPPDFAMSLPHSRMQRYVPFTLIECTESKSCHVAHGNGAAAAAAPTEFYFFDRGRH